METTKLIAAHISKLTMPLSDKALNKLASIMVCTELKKGERFLNDGEVCDKFGFVYKGLIRQYYYKNKKELTEYFAYENRFFVSMESYFLHTPSRIIIEALEPSVLYSFPFESLNGVTHEEPEIALWYRHLLEKALIVFQHRIDSYRFETANERYSRLMKEDPEIIKRAPLSQIASYLLMTPETLSRVRANIL